MFRGAISAVQKAKAAVGSAVGDLLETANDFQDEDDGDFGGCFDRGLTPLGFNA